MKMLLIMIALLAAAVLHAGGRETAGSSLNYVRLTSGLHEPTFEGGRTDFAMVDINGNGHVDILSIGDHGSPWINSTQHGVMVWFNDGEGHFSLHMEGDFGYGGIAVGDVNNDGFQDIAYGMHHPYSGSDFGNQLIEVALGDGTGMNWTPYDEGLATNGETWGMFGTDLGDVNNNGLLDLVSISFGCCAGFHVYLNQGDGSWLPSFGMLGNNSHNLIQFADLNNNGFLDFIAGHALGTAFFGDGEGNFVQNDNGLPYDGESTPRYGISVGDVNNDGSHGLAFANLNGGVEVYEFDHALEEWVSYSGNLPSTGNFVLTQLWDMNANGHTDLVAFGSGNVHLWYGDGTGNWTLATSFQTEGTPGHARAFRAGGDLTGNGHGDIVLLSNEGDFWWNYQNELYVFAESTEAEELWIKNLYPKGYEKFHPGAARFIHWASAVPPGEASHVSIELSAGGPDGPWTLVADELPNNGRHQWHIPQIGSDEVYLRLTVTATGDTASVISAEPFSILGETETVHVSALPNDPDFGHVEGSGDYLVGQEVVLHAIPQSAYHFLYWEEDGEVVMDGDEVVGPQYVFIAQEDRELIAVFALNVHTISAASGEHGIISPSGDIPVPHGDEQVFIVVPEDGFLVDYIEVDGNPADLESDPQWDGEEMTYVFPEVLDDHSIYVSFASDPTSILEPVSLRWSLHPNPARDRIWLSFHDDLPAGAAVQVIDHYGRLVRQIHALTQDRSQLSIPVAALDPGLYVVRVAGAGAYSPLKLVVQ